MVFVVGGHVSGESLSPRRIILCRQQCLAIPRLCNLPHQHITPQLQEGSREAPRWRFPDHISILQPGDNPLHSSWHIRPIQLYPTPSSPPHPHTKRHEFSHVSCPHHQPPWQPSSP